MTILGSNTRSNPDIQIHERRVSQDAQAIRTRLGSQPELLAQFDRFVDDLVGLRILDVLTAGTTRS